MKSCSQCKDYVVNNPRQNGKPCMCKNKNKSQFPDIYTPSLYEVFAGNNCKKFRR